GHSLHFYNAAGTEITAEKVTFSSDVTNSADQMMILIATSTAEAFYGVTADFRMRPSLRVAGGKVCWDANWDCFAWGSYSPIDANVGTPFQSVSGLLPDQDPLRKVNICQTIGCSDSKLDDADDTDDCANDF